MTSSLTGESTHPTHTTMVNQFHAIGAAYTNPKSISNGSYHHHHHHHSSLSYVGFPGLTLTPIPEHPLLDSVQQDDALSESSSPPEGETWLKEESTTATTTHPTWNLQTMKKQGSLPNHWLTSPADHAFKDADYVKVPSAASKISSKTSSVDMNFKQCFLPKDGEVAGAMVIEQRRSYLVKLLLFGLCGVLIVAGIVLWVFSPAFA